MSNNKIALVTGGSRGLGRDMAISLSKKGLDVIITYQSNKEAADEVIGQIEQNGQKGFAIHLDVMDLKSFDTFSSLLKSSLSKSFGTEKIDYLVNNGGFIHYANYTDATPEQFEELLNVHFKGPFFLTQKLLNELILRDNGGIVNISTGLARFTTPGFATYAAMKGAMETLTKYQAQELGKRGIRSNIVAPGPIETDIMGGAVRDNSDMNTHLASQAALGRVGLPDDIGSVVAFLCTDDSKWINAQRIEVSGGSNL
ncbi:MULTISPECIES: SDR family NAD(P)-dependent oxidoreductase [Mesonia]|uniref:3-oxoacyl-[acyl-carrier-protein] reductase FabG n=1 Tax=Mesonia oceanica TaxID=2687242 RepID=A0AC61YDE9_9FLAO|nr:MULTISPECIES: SDR family oxidoreductase [Mesonia]MAN26009.1 short-chain dehydrogenase [Mesonia sp.]MAQ41748.1 short-chain dehydrogenase [Mesonia sp.]MBJ98826.1 short-chain dehydrogenase [Flavobacteriaceae bacterium]VVV02433.1 3-oxoacyl-[acyl-carrier-protein] reductase FabG [Mesonia oceanica]|tara:strand:- start:333 stop:1100 length:768 start_codon:yes stop_codon:yes gene_type:complete